MFFCFFIKFDKKYFIKVSLNVVFLSIKKILKGLLKRRRGGTAITLKAFIRGLLFVYSILFFYV